jgi:ABC-type polysaccharide/polyol phosphate export permease
LHELYLFNPLAVYLTMIRSGLIPENAPLGGVHVAFATLVAIVTFAIGWAVFSRYESRVVKYL